MKKMKKIFALLLAVAMVMGMTVNAFAATETTITVSGMPVNDDGTTDANTIVKYVQVVEPDTTNVTGWKFTDATYATAFKTAFGVSSDDAAILALIELGKLEDINAYALSGTINNNNSNPDATASEFAAALKDIQTNTSVTVTKGKASIPADKAGLYVINAQATGYSYIPMAAYVGYDESQTNLVPASVIVKGSETKIEKEIVNPEDDKSVSEGDIVEYKAKTEYPYYEANATQKTFTVTDTLTNATYLADSVVVKIGETTLVEGTDKDYTITEYADAATFTITFNYNDDFAGKDVTIEYSVKVGTGSGDVKNEIKTNLDSTGDSVTLDKVQVEITKVNENAEILANATFAIYEVSEEAKEGFSLVEADVVAIVEEDGEKYEVEQTRTIYLKDVTAQSLEEGATAVTGEDGKVTFVGLDAQKTYVIKEIVAPEGYSLNENYYLLNNAGENENKADEVYTFADFDGVTVVDTKLTSLPSTGGIGTTIFTIGGCAIMIAAAFFFFVSRRKEAK